MKRNRRAGVEDRWTKTGRDDERNESKVPTIRHGEGLRWLADRGDDGGDPVESGGGGPTRR